MFLVNLICILIILVGFFGITYQHFTSKIFQELENSSAITTYRLSLTYFITIGIIGLIVSGVFYLNLPFLYSYIPLIILGSFLVGIQAKNKTFPKLNHREFLKQNLFGEVNKISLSLILLLLFLYFHRALTTWWDQDEMTQYGLFAKMISSGWTWDDLFLYTGYGDTKFAESLQALFYHIGASPVTARLFKWINLVNLTFLYFSFARILKISPRIAFFGTLFAIATPELSYLATSLKVDSILMVFEFSALSSLLLIVLNKVKDPKTLFTPVLLCYMAVATRLSGAYFGIFCTLYFFWTLLKTNKLKPTILLAWISSAILYAHPYLRNMIAFKNPIFPFRPPWDGSTYYLTINAWKNFCNLEFDIPQGLYQLYLLIHVSLGLNTRFWSWADFLPQNSEKGVSLGWLNPLLLCLFLMPFFFKKDRRLKLIGIWFLGLFFIWSHGVQLTRVLLGLNLFGLFFATIVLEKLEAKSRLMTNIILTSSVIFFFTYHIAYTVKKYPTNPFNLLTKTGIIENNRKTVELALPHQITPKTSREFLTNEDFKWLISFFEDKFSQHKSMLLAGFEAPSIETFAHTFFRRTYVNVVLGDTLNKTLTFSIRDTIPYFEKKKRKKITGQDFDCLLVKSDFTINDIEKFKFLHTLSLGHKFYCKKGERK
ncbi:MAG: hypothetical protein HN576_03020 [Bacteriovoracaceae bacterium]|jgi:hypothetical protein|nr:hypothetical protein [Bacteriovoracaceae bacterium]